MRTVNFNDFERRLEERKAALGYTDRAFVRPNCGVARKPETRALLRDLHDRARAAGRPPRFSANY